MYLELLLWLQALVMGYLQVVVVMLKWDLVEGLALVGVVMVVVEVMVAITLGVVEMGAMVEVMVGVMVGNVVGLIVVVVVGLEEMVVLEQVRLSLHWAQLFPL